MCVDNTKKYCNLNSESDLIKCKINDDCNICINGKETSEEGLNRNTTKPKVSYKNITDSLINKMLLLAKQSSIKVEAITAKIQFSMNDFEKEMGSDFKNYSIVANKYGQFCKDLVEKPENRMKYWADRAIKENR